MTVVAKSICECSQEAFSRSAAASGLMWFAPWIGIVAHFIVMLVLALYVAASWLRGPHVSPYSDVSAGAIGLFILVHSVASIICFIHPYWTYRKYS